MTGNIPPELVNLDNLKKLDLLDNKLNGAIPPELAKLRRLDWLDLSENQLTGNIPREFGMLGRLRYMEFGGTSSAGTYRPSWETSPTWNHWGLGRTG